MMIRKMIAFLILLAVSMACRSEDGQTQATKGGDEKMTIAMKSAVFQEAGMIPAKYTCQGEDTSPPLSWSSIPDGTKSIALICDDTDAPVGTWVHWVIYDIPPVIKELPEGVPRDKTVFENAKQGKNDWGRLGYGGPCPPSGTHRYYFKLYALDAELTLEPGATKKQLLVAMEGHILAKGQLMGKYRKK